MFGFFVGTACLIGLIATVRRRRYGYWAHAHGHFGPPWMAHGGCGPSGFRGGPPWARGGYEGGYEGFGRGNFASRIAERLGLREEQWPTVKDAFRGLEDAGRELRQASRKGREQLAEAFRGESLDENALGEAQASFEEMTEKARKAFVDALAKVHGVLDADQRRAFARFLEGGFGGRPFGGGPYRGPWL
jgi:Spy/CpxP family protein refolding chaperone